MTTRSRTLEEAAFVAACESFRRGEQTSWDEVNRMFARIGTVVDASGTRIKVYVVPDTHPINCVMDLSDIVVRINFDGSRTYLTNRIGASGSTIPFDKNGCFVCTCIGMTGGFKYGMFTGDSTPFPIKICAMCQPIFNYRFGMSVTWCKNRDEWVRISDVHEVLTS